MNPDKSSSRIISEDSRIGILKTPRIRKNSSRIGCERPLRNKDSIAVQAMLQQSVLLYNLISSMLYEAPRSTSHQAWLSELLWVTELLAHFPSVFPSHSAASVTPISRRWLSRDLPLSNIISNRVAFVYTHPRKRISARRITRRLRIGIYYRKKTGQ